MIGENVESYFSQLDKNAFKSSTIWLDNILKCTCLKWLKLHLLFIMVGVDFEIYLYQMAGNAFKLSTMNFEI